MMDPDGVTYQIHLCGLTVTITLNSSLVPQFGAAMAVTHRNYVTTRRHAYPCSARESLYNYLTDGDVVRGRLKVVGAET